MAAVAAIAASMATIPSSGRNGLTTTAAIPSSIPGAGNIGSNVR